MAVTQLRCQLQARRGKKQWTHAVSTSYAQLHNPPLLAQEVYRTLPGPWTDSTLCATTLIRGQQQRRGDAVANMLGGGWRRWRRWRRNGGEGALSLILEVTTQTTKVRPQRNPG